MAEYSRKYLPSETRHSLGAGIIDGQLTYYETGNVKTAVIQGGTTAAVGVVFGRAGRIIGRPLGRMIASRLSARAATTLAAAEGEAAVTGGRVLGGKPINATDISTLRNQVSPHGVKLVLNADEAKLPRSDPGPPNGMKTADGNAGFRVEYDTRSKAHVNAWRNGEESKHFKFRQGTAAMVKKIIKRFSR